jgi:hypothetical protein
MNFEITGRLADKFETQVISDRFQKREFILEIKSTGSNGFEFVDFVKFQTTQDKCSLLDQYSVDDMVKVSFNLRGRKWEKEGQISYFTNLEAWRIEKMDSEISGSTSDSQSITPDQDAPFPSEPPEVDPGNDDLPF